MDTPWNGQLCTHSPSFPLSPSLPSLDTSLSSPVVIRIYRLSKLGALGNFSAFPTWSMHKTNDSVRSKIIFFAD